MGFQIGYLMIRGKDLSCSQNSRGSLSRGVGPKVPVLCSHRWTWKANTLKSITHYILFHIVKERGSFLEVPFIVKAVIAKCNSRSRKILLDQWCCRSQAPETNSAETERIGISQHP